MLKELFNWLFQDGKYKHKKNLGVKKHDFLLFGFAHISTVILSWILLFIFVRFYLFFFPIINKIQIHTFSSACWLICFKINLVSLNHPGYSQERKQWQWWLRSYRNLSRWWRPYSHPSLRFYWMHLVTVVGMCILLYWVRDLVLLFLMRKWNSHDYTASSLQI